VSAPQIRPLTIGLLALYKYFIDIDIDIELLTVKLC